MIPKTSEAAGMKNICGYFADGDDRDGGCRKRAASDAAGTLYSVIYLETKNGGQRKALSPGDEPKATFALHDDELVAVYAYCNVHGLWKRKYSSQYFCEIGTERFRFFCRHSIRRVIIDEKDRKNFPPRETMKRYGILDIGPIPSKICL